MTSGHRRAGRSRPLVLIVDDDAVVAEAAADAIGAAGYRATCVHDGWQALAALDRELPVVMLVDLLMPGMSGSELLRRVKQRPTWSHIGCVIMTGTNDPMIRVREDAPVFYKPVDLESLLQLIGRYCDPVSESQGVAPRRAPAP